MSMSTYVIGIVPPDEKFQKMLKAYRACDDVGELPPEMVRKFFNDEEPDPAGVKIPLSGPKFKGVVKEYTDGDMQGGYEIDLSKLPPNIKYIRFVNSF